MSITVDLSPADVAFVEEQANAANLSREVFARDAIMKAANNAAYLAKLDEADRQLREGQFRVFTMEELEAMAE